MDAIKSLFNGTSESESESAGAASVGKVDEVARGKVGKEGKADKVTLLVIDGSQDQTDDWVSYFKGKTLEDGRQIEVVQTTWACMFVAAESHGRSKIIVHRRGKNGCKPDFVLVRNECRGAGHTEDWRNALFGLMFANVPSMNSLSSIYSFLERPVVQAELNRMAQTHGEEVFPLIRQQYFASHREMMYTQSFPAVVKVGHAHAGMGKMRIADHHDFEDFRSVLAMTQGAYCTAEPFVEGEYDIRLQKIGPHYRAYQRRSISGNWKTNTGSSMIEEVAVSERYRRWLDLASEMFGGLDICTVDAIHDKSDGKEYIIEVNGTSSGLAPENAEEDNCHIRDVCIGKMNEALC